MRSWPRCGGSGASATSSSSAGRLRPERPGFRCGNTWRVAQALRPLAFRRHRFRAHVSLDEVDTMLGLLREEAHQAPNPEDVPIATRDPDDDYLVALAREQEADYLVSGDSDLTGLTDPDPPVLTPGQLLSLLEE